MTSHLTTLEQVATLINACNDDFSRLQYVNRNLQQVAELVANTDDTATQAFEKLDCPLPLQAREILTERVDDLRLTRKAVSARNSAFNNPLGVH